MGSSTHETRYLPFTTDQMVMFYVRGKVSIHGAPGFQPMVMNVCAYEWVRLPQDGWEFLPDTKVARRRSSAA